MSTTYTTRYTESYALFIGIDSYSDPNFSALGEAEGDARALAEMLGKEPFGFKVTTLFGEQATRQAVLGELHKLRAAKPDDRVLVFFSGHGYTIPDNFGKETGYLAAYDTVFQQDFTALEVDDVTALRLHAKAKHVAFIFDCCYSGQALGLTRAAAAPNLAADKYLTRRAYQAVSAGAEVVADYRSMTRSMVAALKEGRVSAVNGVYTLSRLGLYLKESLASSSGHRQIPEFGHLEGSQGGDFILWMDTGPRLPDDLEAALHSTRPNTRLGAIVDLIEIARGDDQDLALLARARLERVRKSDPDERVKNAAQSFFDEKRAERLSTAAKFLNTKQATSLQEDADEQLEDAQQAREIGGTAGVSSKPLNRDDFPTFSDIPVRRLKDNPISETDLRRIDASLSAADKAARLKAGAKTREGGPRDNTASRAVANVEIPNLAELKRKAQELKQVHTGTTQDSGLEPSKKAAQEAPADETAISPGEAPVAASGGGSSMVWMAGGALLILGLMGAGVVFSGALNPPAPTPTQTELAGAPTTEVAAVIPPTDTPTPALPTDIPTPELTATPTLIGGGSGVVAWASHADGDYEIMLVDSTGFNLQKLTSNNSSDTDPAWSPDGKTIAFTSDRNGSDDIYLMNADGSNQHPIVFDLSRDFAPSWSPDGQRITFVSTRNGNQEIYVMQADGTRSIRLTFDTGADYAPAWSPDGKWIAFTSERDNNSEIYLVPPDGTQLIRLTNNPASDHSPVWSSDGSTIMFSSNRDGRSAIFLLDVASAITDPVTAIITRLSRTPLDDYQATFSPDGLMLAFVTRRDGNAEVYIMASDGTGIFRISENAEDDNHPVWKP